MSLKLCQKYSGSLVYSVPDGQNIRRINMLAGQMDLKYDASSLMRVDSSTEMAPNNPPQDLPYFLLLELCQ